MSRELAVVTGASRGIGRATALALAARGLDVALLATDDAKLALTQAACQAHGVRAERYVCDLADPGQIEAVAARLQAQQGCAGVLINNAGVVHRAALPEHTLEQWRHVLAVNLDAVFVLTRALLPAMLARGRGRVINIASISSTLGTPTLTSYCAAKWGVVGFTKALAEELRGTGLCAMSVLPGSTDTDMLKGSGFPPQMSAEEVAGVIVYAALDAPLAMNASSLDVFGP